jgi:hypothetical protein
MFTTDSQPVGIQVGTAIATLVKNAQKSAKKHGEVFYRDVWGYSNAKRARLLETFGEKDIAGLYELLNTTQALRYIFTPGRTSSDYGDWPRLPELFVESFPGVQTSRDDLLVDIDREKLFARMRRYFSPTVTNQQMAEECHCALEEGKRFPAAEIRSKLIRRGIIEENIVRFAYRPFDNRWIYWEPEGKLLDEKRADYFAQAWQGNLAITAAGAIRKGTVEGPTPISILGCRHLIERGANIFPLFHRPTSGLHDSTIEPNFDHGVLTRILNVWEGHLPKSLQLPEKLFFHILAVLWSPIYQQENESALRQDWPRIPIPTERAIIDASSDFGRTVADLLLPHKPVVGVTTGNLRHELRTLGVPTKVGGENIDPSTDLKVGAGWGFRGHKNAVMCGKGKVVPNKADPKNAVDIFINDKVYWANVPLDVWTMTIGGYPVIKKWLSYREYKVLGRALKLEEMTYITEVIRRLKALLLLGDELDANYRAVCEKTLDFKHLTPRPNLAADDASI